MTRKFKTNGFIVATSGIVGVDADILNDEIVLAPELRSRRNKLGFDRFIVMDGKIGGFGSFVGAGPFAF